MIQNLPIFNDYCLYYIIFHFILSDEPITYYLCTQILRWSKFALVSQMLYVHVFTFDDLFRYVCPGHL